MNDFERFTTSVDYLIRYVEDLKKENAVLRNKEPEAPINSREAMKFLNLKSMATLIKGETAGEIPFHRQSGSNKKLYYKSELAKCSFIKGKHKN